MENKRNFTLDQYRQMANRFNKMTFKDKILILKNHSDILTLASDYNWWGVKVKDKEIQDQLEDEGNIFEIESEWDYKEMYCLVDLLGIDNTDI